MVHVSLDLVKNPITPTFSTLIAVRSQMLQTFFKCCLRNKKVSDVRFYHRSFSQFNMGTDHHDHGNCIKYPSTRPQPEWSYKSSEWSYIPPNQLGLINRVLF